MVFSTYFSITASLLPQVSITSESELFSILYSISEIFSLLLAVLNNWKAPFKFSNASSDFCSTYFIISSYSGVSFWVSMWVVDGDNRQPPMDYVGSGSLQNLSPLRKSREQKSKMLLQVCKAEKEIHKKSVLEYIFSDYRFFITDIIEFSDKSLHFNPFKFQAEITGWFRWQTPAGILPGWKSLVDTSDKLSQCNICTRGWNHF